MPKPLPSEDKGMSPQEKYFYSVNAIFAVFLGTGTIAIIEGHVLSGSFYTVIGLWGLVVMAGDLLKDRIKITVSKVPIRVPLVVLATAGSVVLAIQLVAMIFSARRDLDNYVMPRRLSNKQAEVIKRALLNHPPPFEVKFYIENGDSEAFEYAAALKDALTSAGWKANMWSLNPWDEARPSVLDKDFFNIYLALDQGTTIRSCFARPGPISDSDPRPEALLFSAFKEKAQLSDSRSLVYSYQCREDGLIVEVAHRPYYLGDDRTVFSKLGQVITRWADKK